MARIFISYKRADKEKVFRIKEQIESTLGEKCWIDLDGIESDAQFKNVIIRAINECEVVLFMYSQHHTKIIDFERDWTVRELNFAQKKGKRIVFVNIDGSKLTDTFEFDYGTKQQVDGTSKQTIKKLIKDLSQWLDINLEDSLVADSLKTSVKDTQTNVRLVDVTYSDTSKLAKCFFVFDIVCVCCWGYFLHHLIWLYIWVSSTLTYIINFVPILFRTITSIQLFRNERSVYFSYILFLVMYVPYLIIGCGVAPFTSIIIRPFEYLNIFSKGVLFSNVNRIDPIIEYSISIFICFLFCIMPGVIYLIKRKRRKLQNTTNKELSFYVLIDYLKGDSLLWYIFIVIVSVCWAHSIQTSYSFPKILYYIMVNIAIILATYKLQGCKAKSIKKILIILVPFSFLLGNIPIVSIAGTFILAYYIYKETTKVMLSLLYYIICGYIIPFILFNKLIVGFFTNA